ncbi:MAG: helix-turn-helix domain-containing protein, partial [Chloroflexota bacterium]
MSNVLTFGEWLKRRRKQLDITQNELADRLGCSVNTVRKIEQNARRPSKQLAEMMGTVLDITSDQLEDFITFARSEAYLSKVPLALKLLVEGQTKSSRPLVSNQSNSTLTPVSPSKDNRTKKTRIHLPTRSTHFIGRTYELNQLQILLLDPTKRLITIMGPGGMGKSSLALATANSLIDGDHFSDGLFFVPLAPIINGNHILPAIASALEIASTGETRPLDLLISYLKPRKVLLILDNCEHLIDSLEFINKIIEDAPMVTILATSRERLRLYSEQLYPIEGFNLPPQNQIGIQTEAYRSNPAVQLFIQSAKRENPNFVADENELREIMRICRLVTGMPLGIELAATWTDVLSLPDIEKEIQASIDFLETDLRDIPPRHRSLRAIFRGTWQQMTSEDREIFVMLSIFKGGFTKEAAKAVTGASIRQLSHLVSKSLLKFTSNTNRYQIHELLRQFGADLLSQSDQKENATHRIHSSYYCRFLQAREKTMLTDGVIQALNDIEVELDNIRSAWRYALDHEDFVLIDSAIVGLSWFYYWPARHQEWNDLTEELSGLLSKKSAENPNDDSIILLHLKFLTRHGEHNLSQGPQALQEIYAQIDKCIEQLKSLPFPIPIADYKGYYFKLLSSKEYYLGNVLKADQYMDQSIEYFRKAKNPFMISSLLNEKGRR